jgi:protein arginine N-methyltransferase 1
MRIEYHRTLIADTIRNEAFLAALKAVIVPGKTVVADIGAGTGLIGLMAAKLGAREVYLYEKAEVAGVAAGIIRRNRAKNCYLMPCHSREMQDPPRAGVVVSETLGNYALEEDIIETMADARARHLAPGGVLIPTRITQIVAPVVTDRIHRELCAWDGVGHGLDLSPAKVMSFNNVYVRAIEPGEILAAGRSAKVWDEVDLTRETRTSRKGETAWKVGADTRVFGFAVWWTAGLVAGVTLSTAPGAPRTHWEQLYFPLESPVSLAKGESIAVSLRSRSSEAAGTHLAWTATHLGRDGRTIARQAMDLDKGWIP